MKYTNILIAALCSIIPLHVTATELPDLSMPKSGLKFNAIKGYEDYHIVATHFRKDKNELRYILANDIAFKALKSEKLLMPEGSKIVKIGWSVKEMPTFPAALEADKIQRVEYMIRTKDSHKEQDGWGYARFVNNKGTYTPWQGDVQSCVACHSVEKDHDALFSRFQKVL